jgi:hypothetical protein
MVDDFYMELPCEKIRKKHLYYGIKFGSMGPQELSNLRYFIEHFTKQPLNPGLIDMMK